MVLSVVELDWQKGFLVYPEDPLAPGSLVDLVVRILDLEDLCHRLESLDAVLGSFEVDLEGLHHLESLGAVPDSLVDLGDLYLHLESLDDLGS